MGFASQHFRLYLTYISPGCALHQKMPCESGQTQHQVTVLNSTRSSNAGRKIESLLLSSNTKKWWKSKPKLSLCFERLCAWCYLQIKI